MMLRALPEKGRTSNNSQFWIEKEASKLILPQMLMLLSCIRTVCIVLSDLGWLLPPLTEKVIGKKKKES